MAMLLLLKRFGRDKMEGKTMIWVYSILVVINIILLSCSVYSLCSLLKKITSTSKERLNQSIIIAIFSYGGIIASTMWLMVEFSK